MSAVLERVGWIGTGVMGSSMCGHLLVAGHRGGRLQPLLARRAEELVVQGAELARLAGRGRGATATSSSRWSALPTDVREVVLGEDGVLVGRA